ncbi:hypothetical protein FHS29_003812 [Saccharothrix tamanrassetensis]|uniref:Ricin B lectin domain-containing protein n=1 Tax=Saccharothrix tamanrassetensis TaxID=1051531 RepID=A0A841CIU3_9PSEU|nr:RICIN domain-containing protein [Saccharothrix tamanrassetensis]MBB5957219.1 hypothetical protein [Saccharothrix tamanrassetensis]
MEFLRRNERSWRSNKYLAGVVGVLLVVTSALAGAPAQADTQARTGTQAAEYYSIFNRLGGKCLDADVHNLSRNGAKVQLWQCNNQNQQRWFLQPAGPDKGTYRDYTITTFSHDYRKCLDAHLPDAGKNGGRVQIWTCNGSPQQKWTFFYSSRTLVNHVAFKCLDADTHSINRNGTKVQLWGCNGLDQQVWTPYFPPK